MEQHIFPADELIRSAAQGDPAAAAELDHAGFLVQPEETAEAYGKRIAEVKRRGTEFFNRFDKKGSLEIFPGLTVNLKDQIPEQIMNEAAERTEQAYGFSIRWVPGFFPEKEFGPLWGGCAVWQEEEPVPVIVIRRNFLKAQKWFIYDRQELISHELSHAARMPLMDGALEEHFAYALSKKRLRRALGNCFQKDTDAIFFVLPALLLALVQTLITVFQWTWLPIFPFWILALAWPVFLLIRNAVQTGKYRAARNHLKMAGFPYPERILYRSIYSEICTFAKTRPDQLKSLLDQMAEKEFRWKVILQIITRVPSADQ